MTENTPECACPDYRLTRRNLVRGSVLASGAGIATSLIGDVFTSTAFGAQARGNVLVVLSQRGGVDGMSMVVPHSEQAYYAARPSIAVPKSRLLHPNHTFGLHPEFAPISDLWKSGKVAALHAVGLPAPNRSHFEAMEEIEDADPGSVARIGWLNRMVGALQSDAGIFEGVDVGSNVLPTSLVGPSPTLALASETSLQTPYATASVGPAIKHGLAQMYGSGRTPGAIAGRQALQLARRGRLVSESVAAGPQHKAAYPTSSLGTALRNSAALIRAGVGVRAIAVDSGGWDHHLNLSALMTAGVSDLAACISAFFTDLGPVGKRVTLVTLSEFGRRLGENGAGGLDHGYGNAVFVIGAGVKGGYHARWPTLNSGKQVDGDLAVTTDYRHVLAEILKARFPTVKRSEVFPDAGHFRALGFMR